jgi:putative protein kinase ArgK-like GTPase of G3E family
MTMIEEHKSFLLSNGAYNKQRSAQDLIWFDEAVKQSLIDRYLKDEGNAKRLEEQRRAVQEGRSSPLVAVRRALIE